MDRSFGPADRGEAHWPGQGVFIASLSVYVYASRVHCFRLSTAVPIDELKRNFYSSCPASDNMFNAMLHILIYSSTTIYKLLLLLLPTSPNRYCAQLKLPSPNVHSLFARSSPAAPAPI